MSVHLPEKELSPLGPVSLSTITQLLEASWSFSNTHAHKPPVQLNRHLLSVNVWGTNVKLNKVQRAWALPNVPSFWGGICTVGPWLFLFYPSLVWTRRAAGIPEGTESWMDSAALPFGLNKLSNFTAEMHLTVLLGGWCLYPGA